MKIYIALIVSVFAFVFAASAQDGSLAPAKKIEMKKLDRLVGQWKGTGWIQQGEKRDTFSGTENVQRKVDGLALLVEGKFVDAGGKVIHETLAVLAYDEKKAKYQFRTYLINGMAGEFDFRLAGDGFEWGFETGSTGTIRYTISAANDVWLETGEFSRDRKTWVKFFEMKLDRVK